MVIKRDLIVYFVTVFFFNVVMTASRVYQRSMLSIK